MSVGGQGTSRERGEVDRFMEQQWGFLSNFGVNLTTLSIIKESAGGFAVVDRWALCINPSGLGKKWNSINSCRENG